MLTTSSKYSNTWVSVWLMECYGLSQVDTEKYPSHFILVDGGGGGAVSGVSTWLSSLWRPYKESRGDYSQPPTQFQLHTWILGTDHWVGLQAHCESYFSQDFSYYLAPKAPMSDKGCGDASGVWVSISTLILSPVFLKYSNIWLFFPQCTYSQVSGCGSLWKKFLGNHRLNFPSS